MYGYDEPDSGRNYRSGSMGVLQDKGSQNKFGEFKPFAQVKYKTISYTLCCTITKDKYACVIIVQ